VSDNHTLNLRAERMREGLLVIGTDQIVIAAAFARERGLLPAHWAMSRGGRYRKVPGQWSDWVLHGVDTEFGANTRGSFLAVCFYFKADS
jgi:hypothetical protein